MSTTTHLYQIGLYLDTLWLVIETPGRNPAVRHSKDLQSIIVPFDGSLPKRDQHVTVPCPFGDHRIRQDLRVTRRGAKPRSESTAV